MSSRPRACKIPGWVALFVVLGAAEVHPGAAEDKHPAQRPKLWVAPLPQLRNDPEAERALAKSLSAYLSSQEKTQKEALAQPSMTESQELNRRLGAATQALLEQLAGFVTQHSQAREALLAKFIIGYLKLQRGGAGADQILQDIARGYPGTLEEALSKRELASLGVRAQERALERQPDHEGQMELRRLLQADRDAVKMALPHAGAFDARRAELVVAVRKMILGSSEGSLELSLRIEMAAICERLGERAEARKLLNDVISRYPGSSAARDARNLLEAIDSGSNSLGP